MANDVDRIKQRIDIVDLVQEYVPLKPAGVNHRALCPFHQEKTPSFMVSRDRQSWHCFGCSEGGDVFSFVQKIEGVEFFDALKLLAKKANVELTNHDRKASSQKAKLSDCLALAMKFYHKALLESNEAEKARVYLKERGLDQLTIDTFEIGYAPDSWERTLELLEKKGFTRDHAVSAGLAIRKDSNSVYDRFRARVIFPIRDEHGRVVGCTGRVLAPDEKQAKYVNTPQTELFDKGRVVYALDLAKTEIRKTGDAIVMEGQMDVIAAHQFGIKNAVATSGTATTDSQIKLLKRYAKRLLFAFDSDSAGVEAVKRAIAIARQHDMDVRIVEVPSGKDPDDAIRADADVFKEAVEKAVPAMEFFMRSAVRDLDTSDIQAKKMAARIVLPEIAKLENPVEQSHYIQRLAQILSTDESALHEAMLRFTGTNAQKSTITAIGKGDHATTEEYVLAVFLARPTFLAPHADSFDADALSQELQPLYIEMISLYSAGNKEKDAFQHALQQVLPETKQVLDRLRFLGDELAESYSDSALSLELQTWIATISRTMLKRKLALLQSKIRELESQTPAKQDELNTVTAEYSALLTRLKQFDS